MKMELLARRNYTGEFVPHALCVGFIFVYYNSFFCGAAGDGRGAKEGKGRGCFLFRGFVLGCLHVFQLRLFS